VETYMTLEEAGQYVGKHSARWARRHLLPHVPHNDFAGAGAKLFNVKDIDAYMQRSRVIPTNAASVVARIMRPGGAR